VVGSDQKLQPGGSLFYYPDVQVLCDPTDNDPLIKRRPCLVVEVTSDSTESIDWREKMLAYRGIANLTPYLIVRQDRRDHLRAVRGRAGIVGANNALQLTQDTPGFLCVARQDR